MKRDLQINQAFDLALSLTMGQAFRWRPIGDGWFSGVLGQHLIHIRQTDCGAEYRVGGPDGEEYDVDLDEMLCSYFRLDTDNLDCIYDDFCRDHQMAKMIPS